MSKQNIKQLISHNSNLSTVPSGLPYLVETLTSDTLGFNQIAKVISKYPTISARLLFLANSAWASSRIPIDNVEMACRHLGLSMVRSVSIALCVASPFSVNRCKAFNTIRYWSMAMLVADGAALLAASMPDFSEQEVKATQTAGLLHNIGILWLADQWPTEVSAVLEKTSKDKELSIDALLQQTLQTDYCEVGGLLGREWQLPIILFDAMEHHLTIENNSQALATTLLVGYAVKIVSAVYRREEQSGVLSIEKHINLTQSDCNEVFSKLTEKLDETNELARLLF